MATKFDAIVSALDSALLTADPELVDALATAVDDFRATRPRYVTRLQPAARRLLDAMSEGAWRGPGSQWSKRDR